LLFKVGVGDVLGLMRGQCRPQDWQLLAGLQSPEALGSLQYGGESVVEAADGKFTTRRTLATTGTTTPIHPIPLPTDAIVPVLPRGDGSQ
jgi:hypothetical protein